MGVVRNTIDRWLSRAYQSYQPSITYNGVPYGLGGYQTSLGKREEAIGSDFPAYVAGGYYDSGPVATCIDVRMALFSEARFQFQQLNSGRPGDLFGNQDLAVLEYPEPGKTTADLLMRVEQDNSLCGNWYGVRLTIPGYGPAIKRLRPDWVWIVVGTAGGGDQNDPSATVLGYVYWPGGQNSGNDPVIYDRSEVAHCTFKPDPLAAYRGMSWITAVLREIQGDKTMSSHKTQYFEMGGTPNLKFQADMNVKNEQLDRYREKYKERTLDPSNRYTALWLNAGLDASVIGANMDENSFKDLQAAGENRIATAAQVPSIVAGFEVGLNNSSYANYGLAKQRFLDFTMRPMWRNVAGSLSTIIPVPSGSRLWYDDRDIPALQTDVNIAAEVQKLQADSTQTLWNSGFEPDSIVQTIVAGDFRRLKHSGLLPVQAQPVLTPNKNGTTDATAADAIARAVAEIEGRIER